MPKLTSRIGTGILYGLVCAAIFSAMATVAAVLSAGHVFDRFQIGYFAYVGLCFLSGVLGGTVFGILDGLRRWWLGRALLGFVMAAIIFGLFCWAMYAGQDPPREIAILALQVAAITGPIAGIYLIDPWP